MKVAFLTTDNREHYRDYRPPLPHFGTAPAALLEGFQICPGVECHVVSCTRQPLKSPLQLGPNLWYHNLHVPKWGWMSSAYFGCIRATRRKLREIRPDIVHGQGTERDCALSAVCSGLPNVLTVHGNMRLIARVNGAKRFSFAWLAARLERFTLPRSDGIVCITQYTRAAVQDLARRTWVVPNAVEGGFFDIPRQPAKHGEHTLLYVAQVSHRKNQNNFIRALDALPKPPGFRVVFLGAASEGSSYADEFHRLIATRPWCSYEGMAARVQLKSVFAAAELLVLPSLEDNCPMTVLEAMAAGLPVAAARVGGIPELIEDGVTGLLCDPLDDASMRRMIATALEHSDAARARAERARAAARKRFHPLAIAEEHLRIYREVLDARRQGHKVRAPD